MTPFWAAAAIAQSASIEGTVKLMNRKGTKLVTSAEPRDAVVFWQSSDLAPGVPVEAVINTADKTFRPRIINVAVGSNVTFPNGDPILHNVFSVSRENAFDVGLYNKGPGDSVRFDHAGMVRVNCNVHQEMAAYINVLPTRHFVVPEGDGSFALVGLEAGKGQLVVWHPRADPTVVDVDLAGSQTELDLIVRITRPRVPRHSNKHGRPYKDDYAQ